MAIAEFIVSFREAFEIALILGVMLAVLKKSGNAKLSWLVYLGAGAAIAASIAAAWAFESLAGGFEEHEGAFEAATSLASALMAGALAAMMLKREGFGEKIARGMKKEASGAQKAGIAAFAFLNILREGVEMVLMLGSVWLSSRALDLAAALAGAAAAALLAYAVFKSVIRLDMRKFFLLTGVLLLLLAAWLAFHGLSELFEVWRG